MKFKIDKSKLYRRKRKRKIYEYYYGQKKIGYVYYVKPLIYQGIMVHGKCWDVIAYDFDIRHEDPLLNRDKAENILLEQFEKDTNIKIKSLIDMKIIKESDVA